jgi:hypothetical protein
MVEPRRQRRFLAEIPRQGNCAHPRFVPVGDGNGGERRIGAAVIHEQDSQLGSGPSCGKSRSSSGGSRVTSGPTASSSSLTGTITVRTGPAGLAPLCLSGAGVSAFIGTPSDD